MMSKKFFTISIILIGLIINGFSIAVHSEKEDTTVNNDSEFWDFFNNKISWKLYHNDIDISNNINVEVANYDKYNKYSICFNAVNIGNYRVNFNMAIPVIAYFYNDTSYTYNFTCSNFNYIWYPYFDFSDVAKTKGLTIKHKVKDNMFYFSMSLTTHSSCNVMLDPTFGDSSAPSWPFFGSEPIHNEVQGTWFICPDDGIGCSITGRLIFVWEIWVTFAIYEYVDNDDCGILIGQTEEFYYNNGGIGQATGQWCSANFVSGTEPTLVSGTKYFLVAWANSSDGSSYMVRKSRGHLFNGIHKVEVYDGSYQNPLTGESSNGALFHIYCTYSLPVISGNITISNEYPLNGSTIDYYFCNDTFDMCITVNSSNTSNFAVKVWFENILLFTNNTGLSNRTICFDLYVYINYTLNYDETYNWTINASDGNYTNETFNFNTGDTVFCSALAFEESQFFLIIMFSFWCYLLYLAVDKNVKYLYYLQFIVQMPLFLYLMSIAFLNNIPYGYLIGATVIFVAIYFLFVGWFIPKEGE